MTFRYPLRPWLGSLVAQDALLIAFFVGLVIVHPPGAFGGTLMVAIVVVLAWGVVTLHHPTCITIDEHGITFARYARAHRFPWSDVERVRVRRFLVRDRVFVRIAPAPPWRGRYWVLDRIEGFEQLVEELEARGRSGR